MLRIAGLCLIAALAFASTSRADDTEKLLLKPPKGFKIVADASNDRESTTVLVPNADSVADWSEQITAQTLYRQAGQSPEAYRQTAETMASAKCPDVRVERLKQGTENLYPMAMWSTTCPHAKDGGKPETTWWKAVQGRENFYLVRTTARFEPSPKQRKAWSKFFDATRVCDSRVPGQRCKAK
jgi:hypothetical protein